MTLLEGMIIVLAVVCFVKELAEKTFSKNLKNVYSRLRETGFFWPTLLLFLAATIAMFVSPELCAAAGIWKAYFLEAIAVFLIVLSVVKKREQLEKIFWALGISGAVISLVAIFQYITGIGVPESYLIPEARSTAIYGYPAAVALYLAPILVLFLGLSLKSKSFRSKPYSWIIIVLLALGLFTTQAQGAWLAVAVALLFILLFTRFRKWVLPGIVLLLILVFLIPMSRDYVLPVITFQDVSGDVRLVLWQGTGRMIIDRPILGAGLAGFQTLYEQYKEAKHVEYLVYPHNIILNFWVETGILGLMAICWLIVEFLRRGIKLLKKGEILALPLLAVMICFLVYGLVDAPYFKNDLAVLFWVWLAVLLVLYKIGKPKEEVKR